MNRYLYLLSAVLLSTAVFAQKTDQPGKQSDTISNNKLIIILGRDTKNTKTDTLRIFTRKSTKDQKKKSTGGGIDIGFSNYVDNTNYTRAILQGDAAMGMTSEDLNLRLGNSWNVNLWFVLDEAPLIKKTLQLQYGFGLELNNYAFEQRNTYISKNPMYVYKGAENYKKGKLAADYLTVPLLLKLNLTPKRKDNPFTIAGGISGGFLYSARFKTKIKGDVSKIRDDFEINRFKFAYVGELGLGPIKLYGSYAMKDMFRNELNMTPYTIGFRFAD